LMLFFERERENKQIIGKCWILTGVIIVEE
jgi:hypothetical protein